MRAIDVACQPLRRITQPRSSHALHLRMCSPLPLCVVAFFRTTIAKATRCGRPSPCSHPRTGAARNDAQTTGLVEAVKAEEGAGCANGSTDPGAACDDASPASRAARNDAAAASASVEAKQCFKSWWMSMRLAPNYTESSTVVATLRFPIAPMLLPSAASDRNPRNDRRHPRQHSQAWLAGRRNSPPSQLASDPTMSGAYCATM